MAKYNNKAGFTITGVDDILKKIEKANGNVENAVKTALEKSAELPANQMLAYIRQHRHSGDTEQSFVKEFESIGNGKLKCNVGFKIDKTHHGLPAIFLNVGSPTNEASFFIDHAVDDNLDKIHDIQVEALNDILKELKK